MPHLHTQRDPKISPAPFFTLCGEPTIWTNGSFPGGPVTRWVYVSVETLIRAD